MNDFHPGGMKACAEEILGQTWPDYRQTVMRHELVSLCVMLVAQVISYLIGLLMADTGGLSGITARSIIGTGQAAVQVLVLLALPIWQMGIQYTAIKVVRQERVRFSMTAEGFRRLKTILRYYLAQLGIFSLVAAFSSQGSVGVDVLTQLPLAESLPVLLPSVLMTAGIFAAGIGFVHYRFYTLPYLLMDGQETGFLDTVLRSSRQTKGCRWQLCRVDLSYWWYYGLRLLSVGLAFGGEIMAWCGLSFPVDEIWVRLGFFAAYAVANLMISYAVGAQVHITRACCYRYLAAREKKEEEKK